VISASPLMRSCMFGIVLALALPLTSIAEATNPPAEANPPAATNDAPDATAATGAAPTGVVETLHATLIEVMKNADSLGYAGRYETLDPVLRASFDIPFMAEKSVGRHWRTLDDGQRAELIEAFTRFTIANYAGRFEGWSGQSFESLREEPSTHGLVLVHTQLVDPGGENTQLNYRLKPGDDSWKIVDVYLNGTVSELALRRSEYSSLIKREGVDALLTALAKRIDELSESAPADQAS
jgi:phospholipid transport system substrate-binding protein